MIKSKFYEQEKTIKKKITVVKFCMGVSMDIDAYIHSHLDFAYVYSL